MKKYFERMMKIAIPIILSNLVGQLQMLIDRVFLGRLDITCMSAVGNASSPMWTTMDTVFTLTTGGTILISQAIGEGNKEKAKAITNSLFLYNNALSIFWFLFWFFGSRFAFRLMHVPESIIDMSVDYAKYFAPSFLLLGIGASVMTLLQVSEKTKIMAVYGLVRAGTNVFLDYCMIFGNLGFKRMEVPGAALATTIAEVIGDVVVVVYVLKSKELWLKPSFKEIIGAKIGYYWTSVKVGIPTALEGFAWNLGNLFLIAMLNHVSDTAAGIYSIVFGVECIPIVVFGAIGNATLTLSGQETGKKDYKAIKDIVRTGFVSSVVMAVVMLILFIIFPETIMGWFTTDTAIIAASAIYLLIVGIDLFPKSANIIIGSGIKGHGDTKWMLGTQIFGTIFVISMSAIMVLVLGLGMAQLFCVVVADEVLRSIVNYWKLRKISSKTAV